MKSVLKGFLVNWSLAPTVINLNLQQSVLGREGGGGGSSFLLIYLAGGKLTQK